MAFFENEINESALMDVKDSRKKNISLHFMMILQI